MKFKAYELIDRAVEAGIERGYNRAHKHEANPTRASVVEAIGYAVMSELSEILDFEDSPEDVTSDPGSIYEYRCPCGKSKCEKNRLKA